MSLKNILKRMGLNSTVNQMNLPDTVSQNTIDFNAAVTFLPWLFYMQTSNNYLWLSAFVAQSNLSRALLGSSNRFTDKSRTRYLLNFFEDVFFNKVMLEITIIENLNEKAQPVFANSEDLSDYVKTLFEGASKAGGLT